MDPNAWQAYQAYTSRFNPGNRDEDYPSYASNASLFLAHQQLREAASQHYQNQILPPSLVHAAANNKSNLHQQALANLNQMTSASILNQPVNPWKTDASREEPPRRSVIETKSSQPAFPGQSKSSQPAFPGQPPPLQERVRDGPVFPGQPPPRQSSQPRSSQQRSTGHSTPAFPGIAPPPSPQYGNNFSPQAPSPQNYHSNSPQDYQREREKQEQERRLREEEQDRIRREQDRIRREQERLRLEAEHKRRQQERIQAEQEQIRKEQEEKRRREEYERRKREEQERRRRDEQERQRKAEQERIRQEQERLREQERIRKEQERIKQEQIEQQKIEEQQRDLGLARLGALGALNDLEHQDMMYEGGQEHAFNNSINFHELNMLNSNRNNLVIKEEQKPLMNNYNPWLNRANELLDLSNESRDNQAGGLGEEGGFIPQILMNPWDPQQAPMMTLAPIANAMQQYQQQWLTQYQQVNKAAMNINEESFPLGKCRVLCIPPDDDMGFLINLPAPCNLLYQPLPTETDGMVRKNVDSPFFTTFQKYLKDPESMKRSDLSEAPDKPPSPYPGQYEPVPVPQPQMHHNSGPGKKLYIPPYTPKAQFKKEEPDMKLSASGFSRSNDHRTNHRTASRVNSSQRSSVAKENGPRPANNSNFKKKVVKKEEPEEPEPIQRRETTRRKAKEQSKAIREAQDRLLLDEDDPTFNNPALDLEDSDVDDEWTPIKEKDGRKGRVGRDSSDEDETTIFQDLLKKNKMKRSHPDPDKGPNKRPSTESRLDNSHVPENDDLKDVKIGDFMVLRSEVDQPNAAIWRVDGKTLIQKYECIDPNNQEYKNVSTYSGWTSATRHKYETIPVEVLKQSPKDMLVKRLPPEPAAAEKPAAVDPAAKDTPPAAKPPNVDEIMSRSRGETGQFQENFEVYMQTLISQCLDPNFLNEIFSEQDEYFVSNIEKVDSVTLLRKDKLLIGTSWTIGFQHALTVWPCLNDLGSEACTSTVCGGCEKSKASTMVQLFGQPYHSNTLLQVQPDADAIINRNFSVCAGCARMCKLYHKLHHQKHQIFVNCSAIVDGRKNSTPGIDTTNILNELLADDVWLEQQFTLMQDLWADADSFQK